MASSSWINLSPKLISQSLWETYYVDETRVLHWGMWAANEGWAKSVIFFRGVTTDKLSML